MKMMMVFQVSSVGCTPLWWYDSLNDTFVTGHRQCDIGTPTAPSVQDVEEDNSARVIQAAWHAYTELKWRTIEAGLDEQINEFNKKCQMSIRGTEDPTRDVGDYLGCYTGGLLPADHRERRAQYHGGELW